MVNLYFIFMKESQPRVHEKRHIVIPSKCHNMASAPPTNQAFCEEPQCRYFSLSYKLEIYKWKQWPKSKTQIVRIPTATRSTTWTCTYVHMYVAFRWYKSLKKGIKFTPLFNISSYSARRACSKTTMSVNETAEQEAMSSCKTGYFGLWLLLPRIRCFCWLLEVIIMIIIALSGKCVVS